MATDAAQAYFKGHMGWPATPRR